MLRRCYAERRALADVSGFRGRLSNLVVCEQFDGG
jgi:hypothetical protein